jgi:hypothetical protein
MFGSGYKQLLPHDAVTAAAFFSPARPNLAYTSVSFFSSQTQSPPGGSCCVVAAMLLHHYSVFVNLRNPKLE